MTEEYKTGMVGSSKECGRRITFYSDNVKLRGFVVADFRDNGRDFWAAMADSGVLYKVSICRDRWWFGWID